MHSPCNREAFMEVEASLGFDEELCIRYVESTYCKKLGSFLFLESFFHSEKYMYINNGCSETETFMTSTRYTMAITDIQCKTCVVCKISLFYHFIIFIYNFMCFYLFFFFSLYMYLRFWSGLAQEKPGVKPPETCAHLSGRTLCLTPRNVGPHSHRI